MYPCNSRLVKWKTYLKSSILAAMHRAEHSILLHLRSTWHRPLFLFSFVVEYYKRKNTMKICNRNERIWSINTNLCFYIQISTNLLNIKPNTIIPQHSCRIFFILCWILCMFDAIRLIAHNHHVFANFIHLKILFRYECC